MYFQDSGISFPHSKEESRIKNYEKYLNVSYVLISMQDCIYLAYLVTYIHFLLKNMCNGFNDLIYNINGSSENCKNSSPNKFHSNEGHQSNMQTDSLDDMIIIV